MARKQSVGKAGKLPLKTAGPKLGHKACILCRVVHQHTKLVRSCHMLCTNSSCCKAYPGLGVLSVETNVEGYI